MAPPSPNPRRRYICNARPSNSMQHQSHQLHVSTSPTRNCSLRKSATFHTPTSPPSASHDPILSIPSLPRRSPTCSKDLEDTLAAADNRIARLIGAVDRSLSGLQSFSSDSQETFVNEALPVPRFMIDTHIDDHGWKHIDSTSSHMMDQPIPETPHQRHHTSDSGIGSTESSTASILGDDADLKQGMVDILSIKKSGSLVIDDQGLISSTYSSASAANLLKEGSIKTGINGIGAMPIDSSIGAQHVLSEYACRQIQKHIILPIIREEKLKTFHPLISGIPHRVARKEITCLRDLEKVLLWLAPVSRCPSFSIRSSVQGLILCSKKWSFSKASFLLFCETSIQCIHTTVEYLNQSDQRRPTDRPYTNGYFLDLVEQIRQYASLLATSRARASADLSTDANDVSV